MLTTVDQNAPKLKLRGISRPPWIDKDVGLRLVRKKKAMWKGLKSNASLKLTSRLSFLESKSSMSLISSKFCQYLKSLSDKLKSNPKTFWSFQSLGQNDYLRQCLTPV